MAKPSVIAALPLLTPGHQSDDRLFRIYKHLRSLAASGELARALHSLPLSTGI